MAYAEISNGVVVNSAEASAAFAKSQGWVPLPEGVGIGWFYDGKAFTAPETLSPSPYTISKADIFRRATEDEAEAITAALSQASARLQGIYAGAQTLNTDDPDFPMVRAGIVAAVGEARADELLAPS